jgi:DNA polymerase-4
MRSRQSAVMEWPRAILHLDMDAFFVNVHLLDHPEDRGLPLAIGGKPGTRGVVASASYEARQHGVRSAMPATQAQRRCPELKFAAPDWERIEGCSREVMRRLAEF